MALVVGDLTMPHWLTDPVIALGAVFLSDIRFAIAWARFPAPAPARAAVRPMDDERYYGES